MINRDNYQDVTKYLEYQRSVKQCEERTIKSAWSRLRHLLIWAQEARFPKVAKLKSTFPAYLANLKKADGSNLIGSSHFTACCKTARAFFVWAKDNNIPGYRSIDHSWIMTIRPPRSRSEQSELKERELYTVDEVITLATFPVQSLGLKRMQAAVSFLFLSGMRIGAFVSLPVGCVNLKEMKVYQLPDRGVNTKNHKAAITSLLDIPELLAVVNGWDDFLRSNAQPDALWYAHFTQNGELAMNNPTIDRIKTRQHDFIDDLRELCLVSGVAYKSPHKFRHGHAVYALKRAKNMEQMKAISQNLMHSTVGITDGIYSTLVNDDVHDVITSLSRVNVGNQADQEAINKTVELLLSQIRSAGQPVIIESGR